MSDDARCCLPLLRAASRPPPPSAGAVRRRRSAKVWPTREGDVVLKDFRFRDGETLPELRMHYTTLGHAAPQRVRARSTMR